MRPFANLAVAAVTLVAGATLAACGGSTDRSATAFCNELDRQLPGLEGPTATQGDLDALAARYDDLNRRTPLAVQDDWQTLTDLVHTAITVVPADPASVQRVVTAAYGSERAARRVADWVSATCGLTMPAVQGIEATTVPTAPPPTTAAP